MATKTCMTVCVLGWQTWMRYKKVFPPKIRTQFRLPTWQRKPLPFSTIFTKPAMTTKFHKTATKRNKPSAPASWIYKNIGFDLDNSTLDYGCGRGDDADYYGIWGWDIHGGTHPTDRKSVV